MVLLLLSVLSYFLQIHLLSLPFTLKTFNTIIIITQNENITSSLLINELENIKNILESKVTKLATVLQIASNLPQILQPPDVNLIDSKANGIPEDADIEKRKIAKILSDQFN